MLVIRCRDFLQGFILFSVSCICNNNPGVPPMGSRLPAIPSLHTPQTSAGADLSSPLIMSDTSHRGLQGLTMTLTLSDVSTRGRGLPKLQLQCCMLSAAGH